MSAPALETAPDFAEPFEAWRVWNVVSRDGELSLASVVKRTVWPAGRPLVADCLKMRSIPAWLRRRPHHAAPAERCECGIYATSLERSGDYLKDSLREAVARVIGRVALWGCVIECERGFRASHAYPLALYVPIDAGDARTPVDAITAALRRYGVPVELLDADRRDAPWLLRAAGCRG